MNVGQMFPSEYLKAEDILGKQVTVTISGCAQEEMPQSREQKPVLSFANARKRLILNVTNANRIAELHGNETAGWTGQQITLYTEKVDFQGRRVDAIRVLTQPATPLAPAQPAPAQPAPIITQAGALTPQAPQTAIGQGAQVPTIDDDDVPF